MEREFKRSLLKNPVVYKLILEKLEEILDNPDNVRYEKVKKYPKYKRARKGKYRICFKVKNNCIYIGRIDGRSKAYG